MQSSKFEFGEIEEHFSWDGFVLVDEIDRVLAGGYASEEIKSVSDVYSHVIKLRPDEEDCFEKRLMLSLS